MDRGDLPEAVRRPDGRMEPFEPERIARSLFAAAERIGRPDAFLARELTDGVIHFLTAESIGPVATHGQIAEIVTKVVRELGHPALANAYDSGHLATADMPAESSPVRGPAAIGRVPHRLVPAGKSANIFPRDLVSAHDEGLIHLNGLADPLTLTGVLAELRPWAIGDAVAAARDMAGEFLAVDGPEYDLAGLDGDPGQLAERFVDEVRSAAVAAGLTVILNVNVATPPARLIAGSGPLFQSGDRPRSERVRRMARELAQRAGDRAIAVWWHVADDDATDGSQVGPAKIEFVFDRPKSPIQLGPGVDRQTPAALMEVGVNLAHLVQLTGGPPVARDVFLRKVGSLARFAKTAGHVKQDYLRRHGRPPVREGFLLERARVVIVPLGLAEAAASADGPPVDFARDILRALRSAVENDRPRLLPVRIEPVVGCRDWAAFTGPEASDRKRIRCGSQLHTVTGAGRIDLMLAGDPGSGLAEAIEAAAESSVVRLRLCPVEMGRESP